MINRKKIVLISLLIIVLSGCKSEPRSSWTFYWELFKSIDSTRIDFTINYTFIISPCNSGDCNIDRKSNPEGFISEWLVIGEFEDDFLSRNPTLDCKMMYNEITVFDSVYIWSEFDFNSKFNDPHNQFDNMTGNYQKIYLNISK